uniref:Ig-like domain-containing protein n=1 Tax=Poecilia formosa TaxID=48698 RepID=A0A087XSN1_POEFO
FHHVSVFTGLAGCPSTFMFVNVPRQIEALSGSCLQIPCSFNVTHSTYNNTNLILGIWFKHTTNFDSNPNSLIFKSDGSVNKYSLNMIGNLNEENCTTVFPGLNTSYTDTYYLRLEKGKFRASADCDPLHITVKEMIQYSPWSPSINVPSDLKEHQSVTVTCSAFTPCPHSPPELTWTLQQDSLRQTEKNTDGTFTTKIQENITLSDTHDGYNIRCSARYPVIGGIKTAETEVTLSVSYAPRNTSASISPSGLVSAGSWVELSCSSRAKPPPRFTWFRISRDGDMNVSVGQIFSFNVTEGGEFHCVATNHLGNDSSSRICVTTEDAPKHTSASIRPSVGSRVELSCSSRAKPPVNGFTWFKNSSEGAIKLSVGQVHSFSAIEGGEYYCMAMNDLGNQTSPVIHVSVIGLPINPLYWGIIPAGCIVFICLFAGFWYFNPKYRAPKLTQVS